MAAQVKKEIELEIAHVLFLDIVGYSKLSVNEQHAQVEELNEIVRVLVAAAREPLSKCRLHPAGACDYQEKRRGV